MNIKPIQIKLHKKQIVNDVMAECGIIGRALQRSPETEEQGADIMTPDDELTKPIVARSITEGFGDVKRLCQRYLVKGRDLDDNRLERIDEMDKTEETITNKQGTYSMLRDKPYVIKVIAEKPVTLISATGEEIGFVDRNGSIEYIPKTTGSLSLETEAESVSITYHYGEFGTLELELNMPASFNLGMTETIKSCSHRLIVDHVMFSLLFNQWPEKAGVYKERVVTSIEGLKSALQARTGFCRNAADWS